MMQSHSSLEGVTLKHAWVTIGAFDGLHLGHRYMLNRLVSGAHAAGSPAVVVTFFPHPEVTLRGIQGPHYLTSPDQRIHILQNLGVDIVITLTFDHELANLSASQFMQSIFSHLGISHLIVGYDFALGRDRNGDLNTLSQIGNTLGYTLETIPPISIDSEIVSSSRIRHLIKTGQISRANQFLGRPFSLQVKKIQSISDHGFQFEQWTEQILPSSGNYIVKLSPHPSIEMTCQIDQNQVLISHLNIDEHVLTEVSEIQFIQEITDSPK